MTGTSLPHHVVVVGGGFGGLALTRGLRRAPVKVTLIDRRNHHLFQPLLYQVATGALSPANIAAPLRHLLRKQKNADVALDEVQGIDADAKQIMLTSSVLSYDTLVLAAGARTGYFSHAGWEPFAPGLKSIEDALEIRRRVFLAFERADSTDDAAESAAQLTFVIVGGGPTGVELAGALSEIARDALRYEFRHIDPSQARIILVDAAPTILGAFTDKLVKRALKDLRKLGVQVLTEHSVSSVDNKRVDLLADGKVVNIPARTVIWAAGVASVPLAGIVAKATNSPVDRSGRLLVGPQLCLDCREDIFVIGDMASVNGANSKPLPGVAPVAVQQGRHVARCIRDRLRQRSSPPFRYKDRGSMATIGRGSAIAHIGRLQIGGRFAWFLWLVIHLMQLVGFQNRLLALAQWIPSYITHNRPARLITEGVRYHPERDVEDKEPGQA